MQQSRPQQRFGNIHIQLASWGTTGTDLRIRRKDSFLRFSLLKVAYC